MKKFSKIFESKEELLKKINSTDDEIRDICSDLLDEEYTMDISTCYIGLNKKIYYNENECSGQYYPTIKIDLSRKIDKNDRGEKLDKFDDVRNWNGGVYHESDVNLIKIIYDTCYRIESMFSDKSKVYYSIRSINDINIRICLDPKTSESEIDWVEVRAAVYDIADDLVDPDYTVEEIYDMSDGSKDNKFQIEIGPSYPVEQGEDIATRCMTSDVGDDVEHLNRLFENIIDDFFNTCKSLSTSKLSIKKMIDSETHSPYARILNSKNKSIILIGGEYSRIKTLNIPIAGSGLFNRFSRQNKVITIYELNINFEFLI